MPTKRTKNSPNWARANQIYQRKCIAFDLTGDLSSAQKILQDIADGKPPKDKTDPQSPGLGIKDDYKAHDGWFFATGIKGQDNILPHTTIASNPTQSAPLRLTDEQLLAIPVTFAVNLEKRILIVVSLPNGITPQQITKLLSDGRAHADRKESNKIPKSLLSQLARKGKKVSFKYSPNDKYAYLRDAGLAGVGQEAEVSSLVVSWTLKKQSKRDYADMSTEVLVAENRIRNDLSGVYQECKLTAINSAGLEETIDLFDQFVSYSGSISTTSRDISFEKYVELLKAAIRTMPL